MRIQILLLVALAAPQVALAQNQAEAQARKLLSRFDNEPSVNQVQAAALDYARLHPEILASLRSRSRVAAALPDLKVRVRKDLDDGERNVTRFDQNAPQDLSATTVVTDELQLEGEARWKLGDMVFNSRETAVVKEFRLAAKERQRLLQTVTQLYFERRRAQVELLTAPPAEVSGRLQAEMKVAELTGELDALTGGAFSRLATGG